mmetsp:Transcript_61062/g.68356  ORF Transcript_61062/g.68356 Transcript_61062/m.68356 type:complete len:464 (+) Transcript_61062:324-1715(+)
MMDTNNNNTNTNTNTNNNEEEPWYHEGKGEGEHQKEDDDTGVASQSSQSTSNYRVEEKKKKDTNEEDSDELSVAVVDFASPHAPKLLTDSLKTTGFAVVTNTPVSNDLIHEVYHEWRQFMIRLHQDYQTSNMNINNSRTNDTAATTPNTTNSINNKTTMNLAEKYYFNMMTQDGYFPTAVSETAKGATARDLKHYYQLYFPHGKYPDHTDVTEQARVLWTELVHLGKTIVGWIDEYLPPEIRATIEEKIGKGTTLSECVSDHQTMMRILHYPGSGGKSPPKKEDGAVRAAAHEDINLITVLPAGSSRGLQVQSQKTGRWLEVPLVKGSIVINVGDMLQEMSNHAYISTTHRVIEMKDDDETNNKNNDDNNVASTVGDNNNDTTTHTTTTTTNNGDFGTNDRMSTPCFIHLKANCPLSNNYGSAEHYLKERLVTLGVIPPQVLEDLLEKYPGGIIPGWDPHASE